LWGQIASPQNAPFPHAFFPFADTSVSEFLLQFQHLTLIANLPP